MKRFEYFVIPSILLVLFIVWTILVKIVDVQFVNNIGFLGFYHLNTQINDFVQSLNTARFKTITNILMILSLLTVLPFAALGVIQLIRRKGLAKVDLILYCMLGAYITAIATYFIFEIVKINYSPLSNSTEVKASYPSSHVLAFVTFSGVGLSGLMYYFNINKTLRMIISILFIVASILMAVCRLFSGQHYFTDIVGGLLISFAILTSYISLKKYVIDRKENE